MKDGCGRLILGFIAICEGLGILLVQTEHMYDCSLSITRGGVSLFFFVLYQCVDGVEEMAHAAQL